MSKICRSPGTAVDVASLVAVAVVAAAAAAVDWLNGRHRCESTLWPMLIGARSV